MNPPRLVLLIVVLAPLLGQAQEGTDAPVARTQEVDRPSAPPLVPAPRGEAEAGGPRAPPRARLLEKEEPYVSTAGRVMFETLGSFAGGGLGGLLGAGGGALLDTAFGCGFSVGLDSNCPDQDFIYLGTISLGVTFGGALGVWGTGSLLDGTGRFLPTLVGAALGTTLPMLIFAVGGAGGDNPFLVPLMLVSPLIGPIVGYEVSHADARRTPARGRAETGPRVYPVIGASSRGAALGLAGAF